MGLGHYPRFERNTRKLRREGILTIFLAGREIFFSVILLSYSFEALKVPKILTVGIAFL